MATMKELTDDQARAYRSARLVKLFSVNLRRMMQEEVETFIFCSRW